MKKRIKLTEKDLSRIVRSVIREAVTGDALDVTDVVTLAKVVVKKYGDGNCIDIDNPEGLMHDVQYVMRTENCDEYTALVYMSGAMGGGWG